MKRAITTAGFLLLLSGAPLCAAESTEALTLGGLAVAPPAGSMVQFDSAFIRIDPAAVSATYRLTNLGADPVPLNLEFPIPELDFADPDVSYAIPASNPQNFVGLTVKLDGKASSFAFAQSAVLNGRDITQALRSAKLALVPIGTFQNDLIAMPPEQRQKLIDARLIVENGTSVRGDPIYMPGWKVRTSASRRVTLGPSQSLSVELRYRTSVGYRLDTPLRLPLRNEKGLASIVQMHKSDYCIDEGFYVGLDKIVSLSAAQSRVPSTSISPVGELTGATPSIPSAPEANEKRLRERSIAFVMQGRSGQGPYKEFRLVVDKGRADRVVSFCLNNLKRISPTAFEMRATDFQPDGILKVLIIGRD